MVDMTRKEKGDKYFYWVGGGPGSRREFKVGGHGPEDAFKEFVNFIKEKWGYDEKDIERWLHGKNGRRK